MLPNKLSPLHRLYANLECLFLTFCLTYFSSQIAVRNLSEQSYDFSKELNENKFNLLEQIVLLLHYFIKWRRKNVFAEDFSLKYHRGTSVIKKTQSKKKAIQTAWSAHLILPHIHNIGFLEIQLSSNYRFYILSPMSSKISNFQRLSIICWSIVVKLYVGIRFMLFLLKLIKIKRARNKVDDQIDWCQNQAF